MRAEYVHNYTWMRFPSLQISGPFFTQKTTGEYKSQIKHYIRKEDNIRSRNCELNSGKVSNEF